MIEVSITQRQIDNANQRMKSIAFHNAADVNKFGFDANRILMGYIGEQIVADYLMIQKIDDTFQFDMTYRGLRVEVKTICCNSKPQPHYICSVNSGQIDKLNKQSADVYVFVRLLNNLSKGWIVGIASCKRFYLEGKLIKKGDRQVFGSDRPTFVNETIMEISQLKSIDLLKNHTLETT